MLSIHDVGAGGLSNALPELVHGSGLGGRFELRDVPNDEPGMSPLEIWCNEAQERYVVALAAERVEVFTELCRRERAPFAIVGEAIDEDRLLLHDRRFDNAPIDLPLSVLLGKPPKMQREARHRAVARTEFRTAELDLREAARRVLQLPTVGDKTFLVTIGDRTVTGQIVRDQMVGPWQVPVADAAVTVADFAGYTGEAMAIGERTPVALLDAAAAARLAVGEAITNLVPAGISRLGDVKLSANWMAAAGHPGEDAALYDAVRTVGLELCPALGIAIPVGKDSMSMRTVWQQGGEERSVTSPVSLIVSAFAPVNDVRRAVTPQLRCDRGASVLVLVDLGGARNRLGASALTQVFGSIGAQPPDLDDPARLVSFVEVLADLIARERILAYHDRSDGGLWATLCEMAFAGRTGFEVDLEGTGSDAIAALFAEELGAVVQIEVEREAEVLAAFAARGLAEHCHPLGTLRKDDRVVVRAGRATLLDESRSDLRDAWSETTRRMQVLRDDPGCAEEEHALRLDPGDPGLQPHVPFEPSDVPRSASQPRPRVAILREQGVNGHLEMAAAFDRAGFAAVDLHMSDLRTGRANLGDFRGLVACGGFSFGDVLGAGEGWAKSILFQEPLRRQFAEFFERQDTFSLGVCNGCQALSALRELIPGAGRWPRFVRNRSEQFEARLALVRIEDSPSIFLRAMAGARLPIAVAHGEGRAEFPTPGDQRALGEAGLVAARFVDGRGATAERYPTNPNGSPDGITGLTTPDGRATILMPHPERVFRTVQHSWHPPGWGEDGPWMQMFRNARAWTA